MLTGGLAMFLQRRLDFDVEHVGYAFGFSGLIGALTQGAVGPLSRRSATFGSPRLPWPRRDDLPGYLVLGQVHGTLSLGAALAIGRAGLVGVVRPALTSLLTQSVGDGDRGAALDCPRPAPAWRRPSGPRSRVFSSTRGGSPDGHGLRAALRPQVLRSAGSRERGPRRMVPVSSSPPEMSKQVRLPRGGVYVTTPGGAVQIGVPPETIKDSMALQSTIPAVFVVPPDLFERRRGLSLAEIEFPAYFNYFVLKRRARMVVEDERTATRLRTMMRESLFASRRPTNHEEFASSYPMEARPDFAKETDYFRRGPDGNCRDVDDLIEFCVMTDQGRVKIDDHLEIAKVDGPAYAIEYDGVALATLPAHRRLPRRSRRRRRASPRSSPLRSASPSSALVTDSIPMERRPASSSGLAVAASSSTRPSTRPSTCARAASRPRSSTG